jgi:hypothetical protein
MKAAAQAVQGVRGAQSVPAASSIDKVREQILSSNSSISPENSQHERFRPSELGQSSVGQDATDRSRKQGSEADTTQFPVAPTQNEQYSPPLYAPRSTLSNTFVQANLQAHDNQPVNASPDLPHDSKERLLSQEEEEMRELRDEVLGKTGRQNGPDIALKVIFDMKDKKYDDYLKKIINENSSITEVMNVFAFLVNTKDNRKNSIVKEFSFFKYEHDADGDYTKTNIDERNKNYETQLLTVFEVLEMVDVPLFDIDSFKPYTEDEEEYIILPAGIIKRDAVSYHTAPIRIFIDDIPKLITLCILQMINILGKTRGVFGGWTKLFKEMQGGGTKSKSTTKKTRRSNNCRRN